MGTGDGVMPRKRPLSINTDSKRRSGGSGGGAMGNDDLTVTPPSPAAAEEAEEPLSPAARLFHQPKFNCCILAVMGCGKRFDVDVVKAGLAASLARHPRFSSIPVADEPGGRTSRWVQTKVVVDDHVVVPDLGPGAPGTTPDKLVEDYISSLSATNLDPSRPLWDLHILNIPTTTAESVAVLRVHHSLGDGTSLMSLLLACTRKSSDPDSLPTLPQTRRPAPACPRPRPRPGLWALLLWAWAALVLAWHTLVDVLLFAATAAFLQDTETPLKGGEGVEFRRKRFVHRTVTLDDVKAVKNAMSCSINDVLIGVTSAGLSRYLSKKGLPANIRLRTTLLVNIRPTPGIHALAEMMKGGGSGARWGNYMGYMVLRFPIATYQDPLEYVRRGKAIGERKKSSLEAIFTYTSGNWIVQLFGIKTAAALCHRVLSHTTISFSNVIGPVEEIGFYGHPLIYIAPSVYGHPQALTVHFQTYKNELTMVLGVDEQTIPDPHQLLEDLAESLKLIKEAVATRS